MKTFKSILSAFLALFLVTAISAGAFRAQAVFEGSSVFTVGAEVRIPAELIFQECADAVFLLETFDSDGESIRTGSGFFITDTGLAVTNLHVIQNAASATITLYDGTVYPVRGVHATSEEHNLSIISIDSYEGKTAFLPLADSDYALAGNSVYVIGSPLGYINTMTGGIISNTKRDVDGNALIQFTAPISFGSGGSPLLNTLGQVVGITSSSFSYGQNLNLAVPINHLKAMKIGESVSLASMFG